MKENDRFQFYEPNEPITKLIQLAGSIDEKGEARNLLYILSGANALGKTTALVNIARALMFGTDNPYFKVPLFENWHYPKRIRFVSEPSQVEEGGPLPQEISKWWPKGRYRIHKDSKHYVKRYEANDWTFEVMTYEQERNQHEGANLGCVLFNEPPPEHLWTPNISRLRAGGIAVIGMTPLTEAGWFFDSVVPRHQEFIVYGDVEKACREHGVRGHLEHDQIQKMIAEYSADEREARIEGKAMYLKGLIYKTFNTHVHVLKETVTVPPNATLYQSVDPHTDKPFACIWAYVDTKGDIYIVDEWPNVDFYTWKNCQLTLKDYAKIFKQKEGGMNVHKRIIDRHFADVRSAVNKRTLREELRDDVGLDYEASYQCEREVEMGILKVREYLRYNPDRPIDVMNKPKIFINPHCQNTIKSFLKWAYEPQKPGDASTPKPQDNYKDFMDAVRYLCMESPEVDIPIPYQPAQKLW